jgi:hypothetical protein
LNHICDNLSLSKIQIEKINSIILENPNILQSHIMVKYNKPISFITFIIKEIYEFLNRKTEKGELYIKIKQNFVLLSNLKQNLKKLETFSFA